MPMAAAEGPVIDPRTRGASPSGGRPGGHGARAGQGLLSARAPVRACAGFPTEHEAGQFQDLVQTNRLSGRGRRHTRDALAEDAPRAVRLPAEEATRLQVEPTLLRAKADREDADIPTMNRG